MVLINHKFCDFGKIRNNTHKHKKINDLCMIFLADSHVITMMPYYRNCLLITLHAITQLENHNNYTVESC